MDYHALKAELQEIATLLKAYPEALQPRVFDVLVDALGHNSGKRPDVRAGAPSPPQKKAQPEPKKETDQTTRRTRSKESNSLVKTLNLRGGADHPSFRDFVKGKDPSEKLSAILFNAIAVYYLVHILGEKEVGVDHVYTCYKDVGRQVPAKLGQSLRDTASRYGYIDTANMSGITVPTLGENFVEHDLPRTEKDSS